MAASPIQLPAFPPAGPWDAYVLFILWLPFVIRLLILAKPMRQVINKLSPHAGWAVKQLRTLPVKGMGLLVFNEIFAFLMPPLLVLLLRMFIDPIGWQTWSEVTNTGGALLMLALPAAAATERRVALVIGNSSYANAPVLSNTVNDARDMAAALRRIGFEVVDGIDLDKRGMDQAVTRFARLAQDADAAMFYYAGHGLQFNGENFLVPVEARVEDEIGVQYETTRLKHSAASYTQPGLEFPSSTRRTSPSGSWRAAWGA